MENSAGSASSAMEDQIKQRAGDVAPMGSNNKNCKKGCVKPTGPSGNCKVIEKEGVAKRENVVMDVLFLHLKEETQ